MFFHCAEFPTNQLEMNAVADIFDSNHNGYINYKEFIAALWPDKVRGAKPQSDSQKIEDEVLYYIETCCARFNMVHHAQSDSLHYCTVGTTMDTVGTLHCILFMHIPVRRIWLCYDDLLPIDIGKDIYVMSGCVVM